MRSSPNALLCLAAALLLAPAAFADDQSATPQPATAPAASPATPPATPRDRCVAPAQARRDLALFDAIDQGDVELVRKALDAGASVDCPYPTALYDGTFRIDTAYDVPLYRAAQSPSKDLFWLLAGRGAKPSDQVSTPEQQADVEDTYFPFYVQSTGAADAEAQKAAQPVVNTPPPSGPPEPSIRDLTPAEIAAATPDPSATDPWSKLAIQAPLITDHIYGDHLGSVLQYATDLPTWQKRAGDIRWTIMNGAQLDPLPPKTPLNPILNQLKVRSTYTIQNVAFEATPGFFVTGNLFIPTTGQGPYPAILVPHGHFGPWGGYARTLPENQILVTRLAEMGAVVFTWDMIGWGDAQQLDHPDSYGFWIFGNENHFKDGTRNNLLALELWNSIRSVDFVTSLTDANGNPLVDPTRIGATGASGGATQSLYLSAVDSRISAAALVVMINAAFTGDDHCEDGMPVHTVPNQKKTVNTEIAVTIAPKPLLIISDGNDWTQYFHHDEYPYLKRVYNLFNPPGGLNPDGTPAANYDNQVLNFDFPTEHHDYNADKRARAYDFFVNAFGLTPQPNTGTADANDNVEGVPLEDRDSLVVFNAQYPKPPYPMTHLLMWH